MRRAAFFSMDIKPKRRRTLPRTPVIPSPLTPPEAVPQAPDNTAAPVETPEPPPQRLASQRFLEALANTLQLEGGKHVWPAEYGGPTNMGITEGPHAAFHKRNHTDYDHSVMGIRQGSPEVAQFYHQGYWAPIGADTLPSPLDGYAFDAAVQHGLSGSRDIRNSADIAEMMGKRAAKLRQSTAAPNMAYRVGALENLNTVSLDDFFRRH